MTDALGAPPAWLSFSRAMLSTRGLFAEGPADATRPPRVRVPSSSESPSSGAWSSASPEHTASKAGFPGSASLLGPLPAVVATVQRPISGRSFPRVTLSSELSLSALRRPGNPLAHNGTISSGHVVGATAGLRARFGLAATPSSSGAGVRSPGLAPCIAGPVPLKAARRASSRDMHFF